MDKLIYKKACVVNQIFLLVPSAFVLCIAIASICITKNMLIVINLIIAFSAFMTSLVFIYVSLKKDTYIDTIVFTHRIPMLLVVALILMSIYMVKLPKLLFVLHWVSMLIAVISAITQQSYYKFCIKKLKLEEKL